MDTRPDSRADVPPSYGQCTPTAPPVPFNPYEDPSQRYAAERHNLLHTQTLPDPLSADASTPSIQLGDGITEPPAPPLREDSEPDLPPPSYEDVVTGNFK